MHNITAALCAGLAFGATGLLSTPAAAQLPHFHCYKVGPHPGTGARVNLHDQLDDVQNAPVGEPLYICAPVEKTLLNRKPRQPKGPLNHLVCYVLPSQVPKYDAAIDNQLESGNLTIDQGELLCVPSAKERFDKGKAPPK